MKELKKKSTTRESEIDREYKSLMADHKRVLSKIERIVDEQAKKHGISFNTDR